MERPTRCDNCLDPSVAWLRYSGQHLCGPHLADSVDRRVKREIKRQGGLAPGRILVAYSGGKDSTTALQLVHEVASTRRDVEVIALSVDEGIAGYRPHGLEVAARVARGLGVERIVRRVKDFAGVTMDEIHARDDELGQCSYCGVFRRRLMNDVANEIGATRLVTGHNLDDLAQTVLMNLASADLEKLQRLGPHDTLKAGLVPRLMPLRTIPETEVYLYAVTKGLEWHDEECPYSVGAQRGLFRDVLYQLEQARPGTRHALLRTHDALRPLLETAHAGAPMKDCVRCGEPTSGLLCKACELRDRAARGPARADAIVPAATLRSVRA